MKALPMLKPFSLLSLCLLLLTCEESSQPSVDNLTADSSQSDYQSPDLPSEIEQLKQAVVNSPTNFNRAIQFYLKT
ncbi:MAG: hypothetical protein ABGX41_10860 [Pseudohongiella sp.]|jgi:hypothetical protein